MEKDSLNKIAEGAVIIFVGMFISKILAYFYRLIIARWLGPSDYGTFSLAFGIVGIFSAVAMLGFKDGILRYISYFKEKKNNKKLEGVIASSLQLTIPLSIFLGILLFIFSEQISLNIFHNNNLNIILKLFSILIPIIVLNNNFESLIRAFQNIKYIVYSRHIIENLMRLIPTLLFLYLGYKLFGVAIIYVISMIISTIFLLYFLHKKVHKISFKNYEPIRLELLKFSLPLLFGEIFILILAWMDLLMIGYFKNSFLVGLYDAAVPTARLMYFIPSTLIILFLPIVTEVYAKKEDVSKIYRSVTKWIFLVNLPLISLFCLFPKQILNILFGSEYISAYPVLIILGIGFFIYTLSITSYNILIMLKKTKYIFINKLVSALLNITLNILLIPKYGIIGAAIATSIALLIEAILIEGEAYIFSKVNPFKLSYVRAIISILIAIVFIKSIGWFVSYRNIYFMILFFILFGLCYSLFLLITKSFEHEDVSVIKNLQYSLNIKLGFLKKLVRKDV